MMRRGFVLGVGVLGLAILFPLSGRTDPDAPGARAYGVELRDQTGAPTWVTGNLGTLERANVEESALAIFRAFAERELQATGEEELAVHKVIADELGYTHVVIRQRIH